MSNELSFRARIARATGEEELFAIAIEVEDAGFGDRFRSELLDHIAAAIDADRVRRGLGSDPTFEQLKAAWTGKDPIPPGSLDAEYPPSEGYEITYDASWVQTIAGRRRVMPTTIIRVEGRGMYQLFPGPVYRRRRRSAESGTTTAEDRLAQLSRELDEIERELNDGGRA